jgi:glycosyltransferase 2 family protein
VTSRWTRLAAALAGLAVGAAFLAYAFRDTAPAAVWSVLRAGHWGLPGVIVLLGTGLFIYAKAARWRALLGSAPSLPIAPLARAVLAGAALNACVPHAGEFVRAFSVQRGFGKAASAVLSSIVAERVFDLIGVLILGSIALRYVRVSADLAGAFRLLGVVVTVLAGAVLLALAAPALVRRTARLVAAPLPARAQAWVLRQAEEALAGLAPVRSPATSLRVLAWTFAQWLAAGVCVYGSAAVAGFDPGAAGAILVVVGMVVAFLLPNAPGYAGSMQVAFLVALRPAGVAEEAALAASFAYQLLMVLPIVVLGLAFLRPSLVKR